MPYLARAIRLLYLPALIILVWWFASAGSQSIYFPPLAQIVDALYEQWIVGPAITEHLLPSLGKFLLGFALAALGGVVFGLLLGLSRNASAAFDPIVQFLRSLPPPALLPIGLVIFGIGASMNVFIIFIGAIWPTLLNAADGVRGVDGQVKDMARVYRLSALDRIRFVILPAASPQIFAGLRTTLQLSIILIVVSEMVGAASGIGYYLIRSQQSFAIIETWTATIVLGLLGYVATQIFVLIERAVLRWHVNMNRVTQ